MKMISQCLSIIPARGSKTTKGFGALIFFGGLITCSAAQSFLPLTQLRVDGIKPRLNVTVPITSQQSVFSLGKRSHTNHLIFTGPDVYAHPPEAMVQTAREHGPQKSGNGPSGYSPAQIRTAYGDNGTGSGIIAVVDAYHYPTCLVDFNNFSHQFGLPEEASTNMVARTNRVFQVVFASGDEPKADAGWAQESALDIEWTHAMAPSAKIILVEAASDNNSDLYVAAQYAASIPGVRQISISWGSTEFSGETSFDSYFSGSTSVTVFAAAGDSGGQVNYPACSPYVVGVGGTTLSLSAGGQYADETGWSDSGGGVSLYEPLPAFQQSGLSQLLSMRGSPDLAADADPNSGLSVFDSTAYQGSSGWLVLGGTSAATPIITGMANSSGVARGQSFLPVVYAHPGGFHDITVGRAGRNTCTIGWDLVTGWGSPKASNSL